jgi:hypothetical protein
MLIGIAPPPAVATDFCSNDGALKIAPHTNACAAGNTIETKQTCGTNTVSIGNFTCEQGASDKCVDKAAGEWHFVLNGIAGDETACPDHITVTWSDTTSQSVAFDKLSGGVCHYTLCAEDAPGKTALASAIAACSDDTDAENGFTFNQFNVSHIPCTPTFSFFSCSQVVSANNVDGDSQPLVIVDACNPPGTNQVIEANITRPDDLRDEFVISYTNATARPTGTIEFRLFRSETCDSDEVFAGGANNANLAAFPQTVDLSTCVYVDNVNNLLFTGTVRCPSLTHLFGEQSGSGPWGFLVTWTPDQAAIAAGNPPAPAPVCEHWPSPAVSTKIHAGAPDAAHDNNTADITGTTVDISGGPVPIHDFAFIDNFGLDIPAGSTVVFELFSGLVCGGTDHTGAQLIAPEAVDVTLGTPASTAKAESSVYNVTGANAAGLSYLATFFFLGTELDGVPATCEPLSVVCKALTPGYWKNHLGSTSPNQCSGISLPSGTGCSNNGPWASQFLTQTLGGYAVDNILKAATVFAAMNCSNSGNPQQQNQNAIGCLAGHLLAAKLNVANGASTCINATIAAADAFLNAIPKSPSGTLSYTGPSGNYSSLTAAARATAISLKTALDNYNNCQGCPQQ